MFPRRSRLPSGFRSQPSGLLKGACARTRFHLRYSSWRQIGLGCLAVGAVAVISYLALRPSPWIGEVSWIPRWLGQWADAYGNFRNFPAFCLLAGVLALIAGARWGCAGAALLAVVVETAQVWIGGRTFDWADIFWSLAGVALTFVLARAVAKYGKGRGKDTES